MPFMSDHGLPLGGTGLRRRAGLAGSQRGGVGLGRRRCGHAQLRLPRAPGHTVIHFVLARPWEKNVHALKQAQVEVTVK
jgi:hypothetical protein